MLANLFQIPDTFDPDDRRRRQILNVLMIFFIFATLALIIMTMVFYSYNYSNTPDGVPLIVIFGLGLITFFLLLIANRSSRVPGWLSGVILITLLLLAILRSDSPEELYNGRSLISLALPIMLGALILRPGFVFLITPILFMIMQVYTPPEAHGVNYYAMVDLSVIALISWLGTTIANRAIRDARRQAANLQAIYDHVADGVLVLDLQGGFLSANPALLMMITQEDLLEIICEPLGEILHWKRRVFSVHSSPVPELGMVAVFRDETRRHEAEQARDALLATASHELRTPLAATMNYIELLLMLVRMGKFDAVQFQEHLSRALENGKRLQQLVDNILDQAQIQAGAIRLKSEPFDLRALFEKARELLDVFIQQKKLSYELSVAPQVPSRIRGDAGRLQQVLVNLIGNAVKFTDHGGVSVRVSTAGDEQLSIEVADTGSGIPPEQLPDIFEPFRRGSDYAQRERQGAGLGLSIVKEIVTRMHGDISVSSELGAGSAFTVRLPLETG